MKAVVLAGGKGTRLRPITLNRPKPLVPVLNKPILDHIIEKLPKEVDEVLLACEFQKQKIEKYYSEKEMEVTVVDEPEPLGTGGAVKNMEPHINEDFLVFNGDILSSLDIKKFIEFHKKKDGIGSLSLWQVDDPTRYGIIGTNNEDRITKFLEKPSQEEVFSDWINAGMYAYSPEIFDHIPGGQKVSMEHEVFPELIGDLFGYKFNGPWIDIGTPRSYLRAHKLLINQKNNKKTQKNRIHPETKINASIDQYTTVGKDVVIEEGAEVHNSVILEDTTIKKGAEVKKSVIGSNTIIEEDSVVEDASIGDRCVVERGTKINNGLRLWNNSSINNNFLKEVS